MYSRHVYVDRVGAKWRSHTVETFALGGQRDRGFLQVKGGPPQNFVFPLFAAGQQFIPGAFWVDLIVFNGQKRTLLSPCYPNS